MTAARAGRQYVNKKSELVPQLYQHQAQTQFALTSSEFQLDQMQQVVCDAQLLDLFILMFFFFGKKAKDFDRSRTRGFPKIDNAA
jgi:hypothetical protein